MLSDAVFAVTLVFAGLAALIVTFVASTYCIWRVWDWISAPPRPGPRGFDVVLPGPRSDDHAS